MFDIASFTGEAPRGPGASGVWGPVRGHAAVADPPAAAAAAATIPHPAVPRDDLELGLMTLWEETLGALPAHADDDFFDQGGDSLLALDLCDRIRRAFGTGLNLNALIAEPTFGRIARLLREGVGETSAPAPVPLRPRGSGPPLILVPGAGGSIFGFRRFARLLDPGRPVFGLRFPDAGPDPGAGLRIEELAADCVALVRRVQPAGPYHLGGYSFGGRVAFEMARQLAGQGQKVGLLALFDTYGPGFPGIRPLRRRLLEHTATFLRLGRRERLEYLVERARRLVARGDRLVSQFTPGVRFLVPAPLRADFDRHRAASARYRPGTYPGRVILFRAREQPRALGADSRDRCLGWGALAAGGVEVHDVPGAHLTLFDDGNIEALAVALSSCLA